MSDHQKSTQYRQLRLRNLGLAALAGQAGCVTLVIVLAALLVGLWLDSQFGRRGPCTMGMLIVSVPFSLYAMVRVAMAAIARIEPQALSAAKTQAQSESSQNKEQPSATTKEV